MNGHYSLLSHYQYFHQMLVVKKKFWGIYPPNPPPRNYASLLENLRIFSFNYYKLKPSSNKHITILLLNYKLISILTCSMCCPVTFLYYKKQNWHIKQNLDIMSRAMCCSMTFLYYNKQNKTWISSQTCF